jgi:hypothetical protein
MQTKSIHGLPLHASASARGKTKGRSEGAPAKKDLGRLPEWNLADLYSGPDAAEL